MDDMDKLDRMDMALPASAVRPRDVRRIAYNQRTK